MIPHPAPARHLTPALFLLLALGAGCATLPPRPPRPADWVSHRVCGRDTRPGHGERYCIEVVRLADRLPEPVRGVALLVPGMFQNGRIYDLLPKDGISYADALEAHGLEVFIVSVRGIGRSDLPPGSDLDDLAIDDLPRAIAWVYRRTGRKVIVIGHSQGSMTLQAALAGLTRCKGGPCFRRSVAERRQARVKAVGLLAGNVGLTDLDPRVKLAAVVATFLRWPLELLVDRLAVRSAAMRALAEFGAGPFDHLLYQARHTPMKVQRALVSETLDATTAGIGLQLAAGAVDGETESAGVPWRTALGNIRVPVVMETFGDDGLSKPLATWMDDFRYLGSRHKRFLRMKGLAHEDVFLRKGLIRDQWMMIEDLIDGWW